MFFCGVGCGCGCDCGGGGDGGGGGNQSDCAGDSVVGGCRGVGFCGCDVDGQEVLDMVVERILMVVVVVVMMLVVVVLLDLVR